MGKEAKCFFEGKNIYSKKWYSKKSNIVQGSNYVIINCTINVGIMLDNRIPIELDWINIYWKKYRQHFSE